MAKAEDLIQILRSQGIRSDPVLNAFRTVPRERFIRDEDASLAYENIPLPIGYDQTISQPYIIGLMTQALLEAGPMNKVLEIGTGSGYQAAILSKCVEQVYSLERILPLYKQANARFKELHLENIYTRYADGYDGWAKEAPFDGILITAAPEIIPETLKSQLNPQGGCMIIPVGERDHQTLYKIQRHGNNFKKTYLENVRFVPLKKGKE